MTLALEVMEWELSIHRFAQNASFPTEVVRAPFYSVSRTDEELSVVCPTSIALHSQKVEHGWRALRVMGTLDFALTGILASIAKPLADAGVSIFAVSTFDTDYVLLRSDKLPAAIKALKGAGFKL